MSRRSTQFIETTSLRIPKSADESPDNSTYQQRQKRTKRELKLDAKISCESLVELNLSNKESDEQAFCNSLQK